MTDSQEAAEPRAFTLVWRWRFILAAAQHREARAHLPLLCVLADTVNAETGVAWWSVAKLAARAGIGKRACQYGLTALRAAGFLQRESSTGGPASATSRYMLAMPTTGATDCTRATHCTRAADCAEGCNRLRGGVQQTAPELALRTGSTESTTSEGAFAPLATHESSGTLATLEEAGTEASPKAKSGSQRSTTAPTKASRAPKATATANAKSAGTRLAEDSQPTPEMIAWARRERPDLDVTRTWETFRDYFLAQPGVRGRKADWFATWRNWVRRERRDTAPPERAPITHDAIETQRRLVAESEARHRKEWEARRAGGKP